MTLVTLPFVTVVSTWENHPGCLVEALLFPEWSRLGPGAPRLVDGLKETARTLLAEGPVAGLHQRMMPPARLLPVQLAVPPPRQNVRWRLPLHLQLTGIALELAPDAHLGLIPGLDVAALVKREDELEAALALELSHYLKRSTGGTSLEQLWRLASPSSVKLHHSTLMVEVPGPRARLLKAEQDASQEKEVLAEVATQLLPERCSPAWEVDLAPLVDALQRDSLLLVGPSGAGKTARIHEAGTGSPSVDSAQQRGEPVQRRAADLRPRRRRAGAQREGPGCASARSDGHGRGAARLAEAAAQHAAAGGVRADGGAGQRAAAAAPARGAGAYPQPGGVGPHRPPGALAAGRRGRRQCQHL
ncbi:MAG: hypothetical protein ACYCW6_27550 [Candidatus Xenobia bacterium]